MPTPDIRRAEPSRLSNMLQLDAAERPWQPDELSAVLRHQLAAPFEFDIASMGSVAVQKLRMVTDGRGLLLKSVGDLLQHSRPPIELLGMLKDFAKAHLKHPHSPLPREIASVLYYASILVAQIRWGRPISELAPSTLRDRIKDMLLWEWLDDSIRALFTDGLRGLPTPEITQ